MFLVILYYIPVALSTTLRLARILQYW